MGCFLYTSSVANVTSGTYINFVENTTSKKNVILVASSAFSPQNAVSIYIIPVSPFHGGVTGIELLYAHTSSDDEVV